MENSAKMKDMNCNATSVGFSQLIVTAAGVNLSNSDSFSIMPPPHHDMVSTNSIELNAAASLSDDSGVPLTTNSSISSGDSYRLGVCKFGIEMGESDGEVSQFDSLDNCSEGGMSTENFNTLKKGPLAPIDPPPEFQDSPHTTLVRSLSKSVVNTLRRWTSSHSSIDHLKENFCSNNVCSIESNVNTTDAHTTADLKKYLYSSDSMLNTHTDNIYDEPNNIISPSLGNSVDLIESDSSSPLPPPPPPVSIVKIKQTLCPFYQDHTRYFKAILSEQDHQKSAAQRFDLSGLSDIHDYDLYYGAKRNTYHQYENTLQRRYLYSPHNHFHSCHNHYHTGGSCGNRPNSRNSLNSRLSSSHNSLSVSSANKPDDSIFITQAMSHDALLIREITDFYNVPVDSDIYAFPVDMITSERICYNQRQDSLKLNMSELKHAQQFATQQRKTYNQKSHRRNNRNKRKKYSASNFSEGDDSNDSHLVSTKTNSRAMSEGSSSCVHHANSCQEPLHMSFDSVKQFYNTLYSNANSKTCNAKASNETLWSVASSRCRSSARNKDKNAISRKKSQKICSSDNDSINNNVNVNLLNNQKNQTQQNQTLLLQNSRNKQQSLQSNEKKSQFTLNLKQRFCSLFRFRRNHNRCQNNAAESDEQSGREQSCNATHHSDKRKKVQSRALPPLPRKDEVSPAETEEDKPKKTEARSFQFTSSIEKVKDYGWYWGPLSSESAERVLSTEPDGSFLVRDSSDDHYIFSLSFKLNNCVRHVRIEQDQGTFSFGSYAKFKSQTITEFIEKAVEHSRSGRYLFFLHRRPEHGPMRVQLTNPVSRFKHVQSLQHMCRFVILKAVIRKDLIQTLPLPRRLLDYLNYKHCYSEQIESDSSHSQISEEGSI